MAMIDDDEDDDDVAINEISNNMKLPIYAVLVGRVSFLHTLIVVLVRFDQWCFVLCCLLFFSFLGKTHAHSADLRKRERS